MDYGIFSLLPPVLAVGLAFWTRNVLVGLFVAVFVGATMLAGFNPVDGLVSTMTDYLFVQLGDSYNASIVLMMLLVGVFSTLLERGGAAQALLHAVRDHVRTSRQGQLATWFGGMMIWFSDSSNAVILGPIVRPVTDRVRISREKLAYLLDATSATIPSLLPITAWGAFILGILADSLPEGQTPMSAFLASIPFHLYTIAAILLVLVIAVTGWDFGPMRQAEQRALNTGQVSSREVESDDTLAVYDIPEDARPSVWGMVVPVVVLVLCLLASLWYTGSREEHDGFLGALLQGNTMAGLVIAFLASSIVATLYAVRAGALARSDIGSTWIDGARSMVEVILILVLAWSIGGITTDIGAPEYIVQLTQGDLNPGLVYVLIFLVACAIAFATGSSFGTFAIILPIAIPVAIGTGVPIAPAIGAAIAGGIFGDHCSPISDTTVLASFGASCDHLEHVRTQVPYALLAALGAIAGYSVADFLTNPVVPLIVTLAVMLLLLFGVSRWSQSRHPDQTDHTTSVDTLISGTAANRTPQGDEASR